MAIEHRLLFKGDFSKKEQVQDFCKNNFFYFEMIDEQTLYLKDWEMYICFSDNKKKRNNIWESQVFDIALEYDAYVMFRLGKNIECWDEQTAFVINCVFDIISNSKQEGLFIYNSDSDMCYFKPDGFMQIFDEYGIIDRYKKLNILGLKKISEKEIEINGFCICYNTSIKKIIRFKTFFVILIRESKEIPNNIIAYDYCGKEIWKINDIVKAKKSRGYYDMEKMSEQILKVQYELGIIYEINTVTMSIIKEIYMR